MGPFHNGHTSRLILILALLLGSDPLLWLRSASHDVVTSELCLIDKLLLELHFVFLAFIYCVDELYYGEMD